MPDYTLFDPNLGDVPLATAIAGTPFNPNPLVDATLQDPIVTGTLTGTAAKTELATTQVGQLTATQVAALEKGLTVSGGNTVLATTQVTSLTSTGLAALGAGLTVTGAATLSTTQVGVLTATQLGNATTFTANGASLVSVQVGTITANSLALITLKTVGGTVGATPSVKTIDTATGKMTVSGTASDTSTYNLAVLG